MRLCKTRLDLCYQLIGFIGQAGVGPSGKPDAGERVEGGGDDVEDEGESEKHQAHVDDVVQVDGCAHTSCFDFLNFVLKNQKQLI